MVVPSIKKVHYLFKNRNTIASLYLQKTYDNY